MIHSRLNEFNTRTYIGQITDCSSIETPSNVYTNLLKTNPLETTTHPNKLSSISNFVSKTHQIPNEYYQHYERSPSPSLRLSTTSPASHSSGTLLKLIREESQSIPIPNRAQSFDNIHYHHHNSNSLCNSPQSDYCSSPSNQYIRGGSLSNHASPPIYGQSNQPSMYGSKYVSVGGNIMVAKRAISRATSPLPNSVPSGVRNQNVTVHRSEQYLSN